MMELAHITKKYKNVCALKDVSFQLGAGVYGLVGENGAGKTTIMKLLTQQILPDEGTILCQNAVWDDACKQKIGYLPQDFAFFENLTVTEALEYLLLIRGEDPDAWQKDLKMWLEYMNLTEQAEKKIKKLSGGMLQRLGIVQAFLGNPEIILLDEPTVGLDPKELLAFRNMVNEVCGDKTILISTHILDDIESSCEKMICLRQGEVTYEGNVADYIDETKETVYTALLTREEFSRLNRRVHVIAVKRESEMIRIRFVIEGAKRTSDTPPSQNTRIRPATPSLEDAYFIHMYLS